ncbi:MAG: glycerol-3-phosphate 1-O-acyltransferase PlsY [Nitrospirota bacterium]
MTSGSWPWVGLAITLFAYIIGTIPFGVLVAKWVGAADPRTKGSGNIGSTNVLRVAGKWAAAVTLAFDAGKGAVAVWAAWWLTAEDPQRWAEFAGIAVVLGHTFPAWTRFRGGKGVATGIGALAALAPGVALGVLGVWSVMLAAFRYVSLASVTAALTLPVAVLVMDRRSIQVFAVIVASAIVIRHHDNIRRLVRGAESPIGRRAE